MKIITLIALVSTLLFAAVLTEGLIRGNDNTVEASIDIEAPQAVIWNVLLTMEDHEQWNTFRISDANPGPSSFHNVTYNFSGRKIRFREKYTVEQKNRRILFAPADSIPAAFLNSFCNTISLKPLADGTTHVRWQTRYKVSTISANLISRFYILPALRKALVKNLKSLKDFIER